MRKFFIILAFLSGTLMATVGAASIINPSLFDDIDPRLSLTLLVGALLSAGLNTGSMGLFAIKANPLFKGLTFGIGVSACMMSYYFPGTTILEIGYVRSDTDSIILPFMIGGVASNLLLYRWLATGHRYDKLP